MAYRIEAEFKQGHSLDEEVTPLLEDVARANTDDLPKGVGGGSIIRWRRVESLKKLCRISKEKSNR